MELSKQYLAVGKYWGDRMPMMLMEECAELIQAVSKYERKPCDETINNVIKEIADVKIALGAYQILHDISRDKVIEAMQTKLGKEYPL